MWLYNDKNPDIVINPDQTFTICRDIEHTIRSGCKEAYVIKFIKITSNEYAFWEFDTMEEREQVYNNLRLHVLQAMQVI